MDVVAHTDHAVGGVAWLPNSAGFFSGGLDGLIVCWVSAWPHLQISYRSTADIDNFKDLEGNALSGFKTMPYRVTDLALSPDGSRLVAIGEHTAEHKSNHSSSLGGQNGAATSLDSHTNYFEVKERRIMVFNLHDRGPDRYVAER